MNSALYQGWVSHRRHLPRGHAFRYRIGLLYLDLAERDAVLGLSPLAGHSRWAPFTLRETDFLPQFTTRGVALADAVRQCVARALGEAPLLGDHLKPVLAALADGQAEGQAQARLRWQGGLGAFGGAHARAQLADPHLAVLARNVARQEHQLAAVRKRHVGGGGGGDGRQLDAELLQLGGDGHGGRLAKGVEQGCRPARRCGAARTCRL